MIGSVFDRMNAIRATATKSEQKLIDEITKINKNTLIFLSITELSDLADVAEATVSRFCRKLDYKSFQDFKLALSRELGSESDDSASRPRKIADKMHNALTETCNYMDYELYLAIAREIIAARKVCVYAVGNSCIASQAMRFRLLRAGISADATPDPHIQSIAAASLDQRDFLVLISVSGSTKDLLSLAEIAKKTGCKILVITNYEKSPLAKFADFLLLSSRKEAANDGGSLATVVAQIYVADVLCAAVYDVLGTEAAETRLKASDAVADKAL